MAEVLHPIVQSTSTITLLHNPPDAYQPSSASQVQQQPRQGTMSRAHGYGGQSSNSGYRGTSTAPVAPYAFQSTPQLRQEHRSSSAPGNPYQQSNIQGTPTATKQWTSVNPSSSSDSTVSTASSRSKDDNAVPSQLTTNPNTAKSDLDNRPMSTISFTNSLPDLSLNLDAPVKPSPDRYRRVQRRTDSSTSVPTSTVPTQPRGSAVPSGSGMATVAHLYAGATIVPQSRPNHLRTISADDSHLPRPGASDHAKRYRRRSVGGFEADMLVNQAASITQFSTKQWTDQASKRPTSKEGKLSMQRDQFDSSRDGQVKNEIAVSSSSTKPPSRPSSRSSSVSPQSPPPPTKKHAFYYEYLANQSLAVS
jgi:hypothetical protein